MKKIVVICLALTASLGLFANTAAAQNLSGLWVGADGGQAVLVHNGNSIQVSNWAGPKNPNLRGTSSFSGGPTLFRGTFQNQLGEWRGTGTATYQVINQNTIFVSAEGFVTYRGNKTPWKGSGYMTRKVQLPDLAGTWHSAHTNGNFSLRRSGNAYVCDNYQGWKIQVTAEGSTFRFTWSGRTSGSATATSITANRIVWSNGNVITR